MDWSILIEKSILVVILFAISLAIAAYSTYAERKIAAFLQDRIGPGRFRGKKAGCIQETETPAAD